MNSGWPFASLPGSGSFAPYSCSLVLFRVYSKLQSLRSGRTGITCSRPLQQPCRISGAISKAFGVERHIELCMLCRCINARQPHLLVRPPAKVPRQNIACRRAQRIADFCVACTRSSKKSLSIRRSVSERTLLRSLKAGCLA